MANAKAKPIRLIDLLGAINLEDFVIITYNNGRNTYSNQVKNAEVDFKEYLTKPVLGIRSDGGSIRIFI